STWLDPVEVRGSLLAICHDARVGTNARALRDTLDRLDRYWLDLDVPASSSDLARADVSVDSVMAFLEQNAQRTIGRVQPAARIPAETEWASLVERVGADSAASAAAAT